MGRIPSGNKDLPRLDAPGPPQYSHPAHTRRGVIPVVFQVTSPFNPRIVLLPHALVLHVNPNEFKLAHSKVVERIQTRGGFVEQHWGDNLDEISASGSTGAFMNVYTGLSSVERQNTIAWDRYRDLYDLYRNNGSIYDPYGQIVLQGQLLLLYDKGAYLGTFRNFSVEETADNPFVFSLSWTFKVEHMIWEVPGAGSGQPIWGPDARVPAFQGQNHPIQTTQPTEQASAQDDQQKARSFLNAAGQKAQELLNAVGQGAKRILDEQEKEAKQVFDVVEQQVSEAYNSTAFAKRRKERAEALAAQRREELEKFRREEGIPSSQEYARYEKARELGIPVTNPTKKEGGNE